MDNKEFAEKLTDIAEGIEKIATEMQPLQEKQASQTSTDFGLGEVGQKPTKGIDPLLDFIMS